MSDRARRESRSVSAALAAFLRGVERRAAVLAELQVGDAATGDAAVESALHAFRAEADRVPMNEWPQRFWAILLAQPSLLRHAGVTIPLEATDRLAEIGHGPRAAVLLHLAAGLDEADAAAVLAISPAGYRLALREAIADPIDGHAGQQAWKQLREQVQRRVRTLSGPRLSRLARARDAALAGPPSAPPDAPGAPAAMAGAPVPRRRRRGLLALLWLLLAACVLAFAATFWWPFPGGWPFGNGATLPPASPAVRTEPLPAAAPPAQRYDPTSALIAHPDFERLADPAHAAIADELAFYSWLAAGGDDAADPSVSPGEGPGAPSPIDAGAPETEAGDAL